MNEKCLALRVCLCLSPIIYDLVVLLNWERDAHTYTYAMVPFRSALASFASFAQSAARDTLKHSTTRYNTLQQRTATRCNTLHEQKCTPYRQKNQLQHAGTRCNTLQHAAGTHARCTARKPAAPVTTARVILEGWFEQSHVHLISEQTRQRKEQERNRSRTSSEWILSWVVSRTLSRTLSLMSKNAVVRSVFWMRPVMSSVTTSIIWKIRTLLY